MADFPLPPLNLRPLGILDYFGIKAGGWGPRTFGMEMSPTLELWRHYVAGNSIDGDLLFTFVPPVSTSGFSNTLVFQAPNGTIPSTVPAGEIWYVDQATAYLAITGPGAGSISSIGINATQSGTGNGQLWPMTSITPAAKAAGAPLGMQSSLLYPVWLKPGQTIQSHSALVVVAGDAAEARLFMRFVRMRI